jgi:hypothetical protein
MQSTFNHFITTNNFLAYQKFSVNELNKLTDKLTYQIQLAGETPFPEREELIQEIIVTREQIHHIFSHLKYLNEKVKLIDPIPLKQISSLIYFIRQERLTCSKPQSLNILLKKVNIKFNKISIIEKKEIELLVYMARNEKKIVQTSSQFNTLYKRFILLKVNSNKRQKIN